MTVSPTQRSLAEARSRGWQAAVTEHWNQFAGIRQDLFNFVDILCVDGKQTIAIQATSTLSNAAERKAKILHDPKVSPKARRCLESGWKVYVWAWPKHVVRKTRGKRDPNVKPKLRADLAEIEITLDMFTKLEDEAEIQDSGIIPF